MLLKLENTMNKKHYKDYLITILITLIITFSVALFFQLELLFRCEKKVNFEELNLKNLSKFYTIEQLEKIIKKYPKNTAAYIKIANIYEQLNELKNASDYYKKALVVSKRSNFSLYSYAVFCANQGFLNLATTLAEEITANNPKTYEYRAVIYEKIADNLLDENPQGANKAYQIAYKYAKNAQNNFLKKQIQKKYALSYTKTADEKIKEKLIDEALYDLNNSLKIMQNPLAQYKLALIYKDIDPELAERYLSRTLREDPYLINPYIYNSILNNLYKIANETNNNGDINYYSNQMKKFKKKLQNAYLYKDDVEISNTKIIAQKKPFSKQINYILNFNIKNNTDTTIKNLYFDVEIITQSKTHKIEKQLITNINPLLQYKNTDFNVDIDNSFHLSDIKKNNNIYIKYYCKKAKNAPWTLVTIQYINI